MKAIVLHEKGEPENLKYEDVPDLEPAAGQIVVKLKAAALNHRDVWIRKGMYAGLKFPIVLGSDGAGEIVLGPHLRFGNLQGLTTRMSFVHGCSPLGR